MYINEVTLYGRLTRDVELKVLPNGTPVANFSIATTRTWKGEKSQEEETEFSNIVFYGKRAEVLARYVFKGHTIYVRGRLKTRDWEKDGVKHYRTEIVGEDFKFGDGNPRTDGAQAAAPAAAPANSTAPVPPSTAPAVPDYPEEEINPEDIPF